MEYPVKFAIANLLLFPTTGELIRPGDTKCVLNEGMPMYRRPFEKGRLIIHFSVRAVGFYFHFNKSRLILPAP